MTTDSERICFWLDELTLMRALGVLWTVLTLDTPVEVGYLARGRSAGLATALLHLGGVKVPSEPHPRYFDNRRSFDGGPIRYRFSEILDTAIKTVVTSTRVDALLDHLQTEDRDRILLYLRQETKSSLRSFTLDLMALRQAADRADPAGEDRYVLARVEFCDAVLDNVQWKDRESVTVYGRVGWIPRTLYSLAALAKDTVKASWLMVQARWTRRDPDWEGGTARSGPKVAVQAYKGLDRGRRSDLIWWDGNEIDPSEILLYCLPSYARPTPAWRKRVEGEGMGWVDWAGWRPVKAAPWYARYFWSAVGSTLRHGLRCLVESGLGAWDLRAAIRFQRLYARDRAFAAEYDVKVRISYTEVTSAVIPGALALEDAGGIDAQHVWSAWPHEFPSDSIVPAKHAYFVWGPIFLDKLEGAGTVPESILFCGQLALSHRSKIADRAKQVRNRLAGRPVVGVLDNYPSIQTFPPDALSEFYETVLDLAERHGLSLVVKPKIHQDILERVGLGDRRKRLEEEGRLVVLEPGQSVTEAALASDLTIGCQLNSAVMEAAGAGVPGIHYDVGGIVRYPLYETGRGRVIATDPTQLESMVEEFIETEGKTGIGDHSPYMSFLNPHRDGKAADRASRFLRWFLDARLEEDEGDVQRALRVATEKFADNFGKPMAVYRRRLATSYDPSLLIKNDVTTG